VFSLGGSLVNEVILRVVEAKQGDVFLNINEKRWDK